MDGPYIHRLFESRAQASAGLPAVRSAGGEITYEHLDRASDIMAAELAVRAGGAGSIVGVYLEPGLEYVVSILAILKAGAAYLPLSTNFPRLRLASLLDLARPGLVVTNARLEAEVRGLVAAVHPFDEALLDAATVRSNRGATKSELDELRGRGRRPGHDPDACYLLSTSGSTGEPKAILGSHRGLCHFIEWEVGELDLGPDARVSWLSHPTFDVSLRDIFVPLCCGGTLCVPEESVKTDPRALLRWFEGQRITLTHIVPTLFRLLTEAVIGRIDGGTALPGLCWALVAGEPLYGYDAIRWTRAVGDHARLINLYGPSETTLAKLFYPVNASKLDPGAIVPLGKPIPGARVLILDEDRVCGVEEEGEICIETPFRSHGYFRNPGLTGKVFVKNPADPGSPEPLYRTGDIGRMLRDGNVQFLGRRDGQVKLHGVRIELGEIEAALSQDPRVKLAAAAVRFEEDGPPRLVAYFVPMAGEEPSVESLREFLAQRLPGYMIPNVFVVLDALPLTTSGKIDRGRLPAPGTTRPTLGQAYVSASNAIEARLVEIWGEALELRSVGVDDNFFDLGGNSILAARLSRVIGEAFHVDVPIVKLFEFPNIRLLAGYIAGEGPGKAQVEDFERRARQRRLRRLRPGTL